GAAVQFRSAGGWVVIRQKGGGLGGGGFGLGGGRRRFPYTWLGGERSALVARGRVPAGERHIRFEFAYDGGKPGAGGLGRIAVDGTSVAEGRIARTQPNAFSGDEGADVGEGLATPVSEEYPVPAAFTGTIHQVTIEVQPIAAADRATVEESTRLGLERRATFD